jgi:hypothetical protein
MDYTTIRISKEDKRRLERLARLLNRNATQALRYAIDAAEREANRFKGDVNKVMSSLRYAKDIGETNAEDIDVYLYGGSD